MTKEQFENNTNWKITYEEYQKCDCTECSKTDCMRREKEEDMKGYNRIDKYLGFELWENKKYGDEVPAKVTHNGVVVGETYNSLQEFVEDYMYE